MPFLAHQLSRVAEAGVSRVVLATAYRAQMFADSLGDGSAFGLEICYVQEDTPLGTGGAIRNAAAGLRGGPGGAVIVLNGDILSGHDLTAQVKAHTEARAAVTLHLVEVDDPSRFGCVPTDAEGRVTAFLEKTPDPVTNRINAGCYVFRREVIDVIPPGVVSSVERKIFPELISAGEVVFGYVDASYWLDVGTPEAFVTGSCDLVLGRVTSPALRAADGLPGERLLPAGAVVEPGASVVGGTVAGRGLGDRDGSAGDAERAVRRRAGRPGRAGQRQRSLAAARSRRRAGVVLEGAVIGDGAVIAEGNELRAGARVWPDVTLGPTSVRFSTDV